MHVLSTYTGWPIRVFAILPSIYLSATPQERAHWHTSPIVSTYGPNRLTPAACSLHPRSRNSASCTALMALKQRLCGILLFKVSKSRARFIAWWMRWTFYNEAWCMAIVRPQLNLTCLRTSFFEICLLNIKSVLRDCSHSYRAKVCVRSPHSLWAFISLANTQKKLNNSSADFRRYLWCHKLDSSAKLVKHLATFTTTLYI